MKNRRWMYMLLALSLVFGLALTACGGDDDDEDTANEIENLATEASGALEGAATEASDIAESAATEASDMIDSAATEAASAAGEMEDAVAGTEVAMAEGDPAHGEELVQAQCVSCHAIDKEQTIVGPSLYDIGSEAGDMVEGQSAEEYLHESLVDPGAYVVEGFDNIMPSFDNLPESDLNDIVAYLMTLDGGAS